MSSRWARGGVRVERVGAGVWLELGGFGLLLDAPGGLATHLEGRVDGVLLTSGRLERLAGLLEVLAGHDDLTLWVPLTDDRGALVGELAQQAWGRSVVLDALAPGADLVIGPAKVRVVGLTGVDDEPVLGVRLTTGGITLAYLPRCVPDRSARHLVQGAEVVIPEAGAFSPSTLLDLAGTADLLLDTLAVA